MSFTGYNEINSHKAVEKWLFLVLIIVYSGCTGSQLFNLLFWQLYLACTSLKAILTSRNCYYFFMNGIDYSSVIWIPSNNSLVSYASRKRSSPVQWWNPVAQGYCLDTTLFARCLIYLAGTWTFECHSTTLLLWNMRQTYLKKWMKYLLCHFCLSNTGIIILALLATIYFVY